MVFVFFDNENATRDIPPARRQFFDECRRNLSDDNYRKVFEWINVEIDLLVANTSTGKKPFFKSGALVGKERFPPNGSWTPPMLSVYEAAGKDEELAKYFYGLICWTVVIDRDERWLGYKDESQHLKGMVYFRHDPKSEAE